MNKNALVTAFVTIVGLLFALVLGSFVAESNLKYLAFITGAACLASVCLALRQNIWMLIPLCSSLTGSIGVLPLNLAVSEIAILIAFGMFVVFTAMKSLPPYPRANICDGLLLLNIAYLITVYARNPAGLLIMETEIIGGRPYFSVFVALLGYWVLQNVTLEPRQGLAIPFLACSGSILNGLLGSITAISPSLAYKIYPFYSGVTLPASHDPSAVANDGEARLGFLSNYATTVGSALVAYRDPIRLLLFLTPLFSVVFYSTIVAVLYSGFRSLFAYLVVMSGLSVYFRFGLSGVVKVSTVIFAALAIIVTCQNAGLSLPVPAQRALSFIPASWDALAVADANSSSEWRFEMWKQALLTDRYIRNKVFGDGFGYRIQDIQGFMSMGGMQAASPEQIQDYFLVVGAYHSGPVSAIRYVGIVGLILITVFMLAAAAYAWKLVIRSQGTPFFVMALFVCSPAIYMPVAYWFIFGAADTAFVTFAINLAMLNLLDRSLKAKMTDIKYGELASAQTCSAGELISRAG